jgi:hypothetical protein
MKTVIRIISAIALLALMAFSVFGFLASFEPSEVSRLPWQIGYALVGATCLSGAIVLMRTRGHKE